MRFLNAQLSRLLISIIAHFAWATDFPAQVMPALWIEKANSAFRDDCGNKGKKMPKLIKKTWVSEVRRQHRVATTV